MKTAVAVIIILIIVYFVVSFVLAELCGILLVTPPLRFRPSKEQVIESDVREFASKHTMYAGADYADYEKWDAEKFILKNNGVGIPAVYHKQEHARGCVILAHGFGQNRYASVPYAELFRSLGFSTLLFDQRCFGESEAPNGGFGELEAGDVAALINWVKEKCGKNEKIVLHGVSMGAMSCMNALLLSDQIDGVIEDCGSARALEGAVYVWKSMVPLPNPFLKSSIIRKADSLGLHMKENSPVKAVENSEVPICIIHGDADQAVPVSDAEAIFKVCKNPKSRLEVFPSRGHAYSICDAERYKEILAGFLEEVCCEEQSDYE